MPQVWIAVHLYDLALNAVVDADLDKPTAVVEPRDGQLRIIAANECARRFGIDAGLTVGSALTLADSLELVERSVTAERKRLEALAVWADKLTPIVSLDEPGTLLLEVGGSLKLFAGLENVKRTLGNELMRRRLRFRIGTAPTPLAARWLARHGDADVLTRAELTGHLAALPLSVTGWPDRIQQLLRRMGVGTIGGCLRLPRAGFAHRIGRQYLDELDRALGKRPNPQRRFEGPRRLSLTFELGAETTDRELFGRFLEAGVARVAADLRARQAELREVELVFHHLHGARTKSLVRYAEPVHTADRILAPLIARMERIELAGPAVALGLETDSLQPMQMNAARLFRRIEDGGAAQVSELALIECYRGRFGAESVYGIELLAEHRPELAWGKLKKRWSASRSEATSISPWADERPLWILSAPRPVSEDGLGHGHRIELASEPERIESGWWDGYDIRRDYYVAITAGGEKLWVYRDCRTRQWYLHGVFG